MEPIERQIRTRLRNISLIRALLRQHSYRLSTIAPLLAVMRHLNSQLTSSYEAIEHIVGHDARV